MKQKINLKRALKLLTEAMHQRNQMVTFYDELLQTDTVLNMDGLKQLVNQMESLTDVACEIDHQALGKGFNFDGFRDSLEKKTKKSS